MASETLTINVRENGSRVVSRSIDEIGAAADRATRGLYLFQRAIFTLGAAGGVAALTNMVDALNLMENRLRLTTSGTLELEGVQQKLFDVANRSRSSLIGTAEIYNRMALSAKELGLETQDLIDVTETLNKASILSGASTREANAALIQLGQGIASNRLGGDELRSILEQLPYVADLIARSLGVTRGELRKLGSEGKLNAQVVIDAFKEAKAEVDQLFANTTPTIGQSLTVVITEALRELDNLDDKFNFSASIATAILGIANAMKILIPLTVVLAASVAGIFADRAISSIVAYTTASERYYNLLRSGNLVVLGSAAAERQKAAFYTESARAQAVSTAATVANVNAQRQALAATVAGLQSQLALTQAEIADARALAAQTGSYTALIAAKERANVINAGLIATQTALTATNARLAVAQTAVAASATAQAAALSLSFKAAYASSTVFALLAARLPIVATLVGTVTAAFRALWVTMLANPITTLVVILGALYLAFGNAKTNADLLNESISKTEGYMNALSAATDVTTGKIDLAAESLKKISLIQAQADLQESVKASSRAFQELLIEVGKFGGAEIGPALQQRFYDLIRSIEQGKISAREFATGLNELAAESGDPRFFQLVKVLNDKAQAAAGAEENVNLLNSIVGVLTGSLPALSGSLNGAAGAANNLAGAASAASGAIDTLISKIPAMAAAARVQAGLGEANAALAAGQAGLQAQFKAGQFTVQEYAARQANLTRLNRLAVDEITGLAQKQRDATSALKDYNKTASMAGLSGTDRQLAEAANQYNELTASLKAAGASQADLNAAATSYAAIQAGIRKQEAERASKRGGSGGSGSSIEDLAGASGFLQKIKEETAAVKLTNQERVIAQGLIKLETDLKRTLTAAEREQATAALKNLEIAKQMGQVLEELRGPQESLQTKLAAINQLMAEGTLTADEYARAMRGVAISNASVANTFTSGLAGGIAQVAAQADNLGEQVSGWVVQSFDSAANAIVEFAKTGQINIRQLFQDIFANLLKIATNQLFAQLLGGLFKGAGGGGGLFAGLLGLPGAATGGSIMPNGIGQTDTQVVAFRKRPDERVDILTPAQQRAQEAAMGGAGQSGGGAPQVNVAGPTIINVDDPGAIPVGIASAQGSRAIVNVIRQNREAIKRMLS